MIKIAKPLSAYKGKQRAGKWFEKQVVEPALNSLERSHSGFQHRFVDTNEARNVVRGQPSDYLYALGGRAFLLEAKASESRSSFIPSLLEPAQVSGILRWVRSGNRAFIVFCDCKEGRVDLIDGQLAVGAKMEGKRLRKEDYLAVGNIEELDEILIRVSKQERIE